MTLSIPDTSTPMKSGRKALPAAGMHSTIMTHSWQTAATFVDFVFALRSVASACEASGRAMTALISVMRRQLDPSSPC